MKTWSLVIPARMISAVLMQPHGDGVETPSLLSRLLYCAVNHYSGRGGHVQQFTTQSWQASTRLRKIKCADFGLVLSLKSAKGAPAGKHSSSSKLINCF